MSLRDSILGGEDSSLQLREVTIPEWGVSVWLRGMNSIERDAFEASLPDGPERLRNFRAKLAVMSCFDAEGNRLFQTDDTEALGKKSGSALDRIAGIALRLSGISREEVDAAKKDSPGEPGSGSPSSSP
jgi:hypothetical protein